MDARVSSESIFCAGTSTRRQWLMFTRATIAFAAGTSSSSPARMSTDLRRTRDRAQSVFVRPVSGTLNSLRQEPTAWDRASDVQVEQSAAKRGIAPKLLADENSAAFRSVMEEMGISFDDFIRTTDDYHERQVQAYVSKCAPRRNPLSSFLVAPPAPYSRQHAEHRRLQILFRLKDNGSVYLGQFEGWYDQGQEEYYTEMKAKDLDYKSPITGKDLVKATEDNYYFRLSAFQGKLEARRSPPGITAASALCRTRSCGAALICMCGAAWPAETVAMGCPLSCCWFSVPGAQHTLP